MSWLKIAFLVLGLCLCTNALTQKNFMDLCHAVINKGWESQWRTGRGSNIGSVLTFTDDEGEFPFMWSLNSAGFHNGLHGERNAIDIVTWFFLANNVNEVSAWKKIKVYTNLQPCWMCTTEFLARTHASDVLYAMKDDTKNANCKELYKTTSKSNVFQIDDSTLFSKYIDLEPHSALRNPDCVMRVSEKHMRETMTMTFLPTSEDPEINSCTDFPYCVHTSPKVKSHYASAESELPELLKGLLQHIKPFYMEDSENYKDVGELLSLKKRASESKLSQDDIYILQQKEDETWGLMLASRFFIALNNHKKAKQGVQYYEPTILQSAKKVADLMKVGFDTGAGVFGTIKEKIMTGPATSAWAKLVELCPNVNEITRYGGLSGETNNIKNCIQTLWDGPERTKIGHVTDSLHKFISNK